MAVLVAESKIQRNGAAEFLIQSDVAQQRRAHPGGLHGSVVQLGVREARAKKARKKRKCENP